jgi:uncharacterized repeat protein (TIGR01451 family)
VLANGAKSATIRLTTGGETYYPSVVFFTTDIYSPEIRPAKSVVDLDGGATERGEVLEYTVRLTNAGQDAATGLRFFDPIPARSTYVPGSLGRRAARRRAVTSSLSRSVPPRAVVTPASGVSAVATARDGGTADGGPTVTSERSRSRFAYVLRTPAARRPNSRRSSQAIASAASTPAPASASKGKHT